MRILLAGTFCLAFLWLGTRLIWLASRTETGWEMLGRQWRDATIGWVAGKETPIGMREPIEQADFWLHEVDRIVNAHLNDAGILMGAAMVLDEPAPGFEQIYLKKGGTGWRLAGESCVRVEMPPAMSRVGC